MIEPTIDDSASERVASFLVCVERKERSSRRLRSVLVGVGIAAATVAYLTSGSPGAPTVSAGIAMLGFH